MKILCNTEFYYSGVRLYNAGNVYDITAKEAEELIALDKKKPLGALSFFSPVDEEAVNYFKGLKGNKPEETDEGNKEPDAPNQPTRAELIEKAKSLGIQGANRMKTEELKETIAAAKQNQPEQTVTTDSNAQA